MIGGGQKTSSVSSGTHCVLWHSNAFIKFLNCSQCFPNGLNHLFFASFAALPSVISMSICLSVTWPLLLSYEAVESTVNDCCVYCHFFYALNWWSYTWDPTVPVAAGFASQTLSPLSFLFLFALVNLFQESLTGCTGSYLPTSTSPFVGSGRGSFPFLHPPDMPQSSSWHLPYSITWLFSGIH